MKRVTQITLDPPRPVPSVPHPPSASTIQSDSGCNVRNLGDLHIEFSGLGCLWVDKCFLSLSSPVLALRLNSLPDEIPYEDLFGPFPAPLCKQFCAVLYKHEDLPNLLENLCELLEVSLSLKCTSMTKKLYKRIAKSTQGSLLSFEGVRDVVDRLEEFLALPWAAVVPLLLSPNFTVDSENSLLYITTKWARKLEELQQVPFEKTMLQCLELIRPRDIHPLFLEALYQSYKCNYPQLAKKLTLWADQRDHLHAHAVYCRPNSLDLTFWSDKEVRRAVLHGIEVVFHVRLCERMLHVHCDSTWVPRGRCLLVRVFVKKPRGYFVGLGEVRVGCVAPVSLKIPVEHWSNSSSIHLNFLYSLETD